MLRLLGSAAMIATLAAPALQAQSQPLETEQWQEIRGFLERNPGVVDQLEAAMARELSPDQAAQDAAFIADQADTLYEDPLSPVLGNPDGEVLVVKFSDFRCPHCRSVTPELEQLVEGDDRVKLIVKELPILGDASVEAAKFALAAYDLGGSEAYDRVQEALFENQRARITGYFLEDLAETAGLDPRAVIERMDSDAIEEHLEANRDLAEGLKISGTPAILVGDVVVRGAAPVEALRKGVSEVYGD